MLYAYVNYSPPMKHPDTIRKRKIWILQKR